jgi:hypothetical protein
MDSFEDSRIFAIKTAAYGFAQRLVRWSRNRSFHERYLAAATDHADLERRERALERTTTGPAFVTFNH